ncbi:MAG: hypothetical protein K5895_01505 [Lachnospiraceae bacterium]|nr:hypothetical protein [Lachnospiraceae bacterium]
MKKRVLAIIIMIAVAVITAVPASMVSKQTANAASVKISAKKATLKVGDKKTLKITGTKKSITWTTTNKNIVKIKKTKKSKQVVTAVGVGKAKVIAKIGKKKYTCAFTVKSSIINPETPTRPAKTIDSDNEDFIIKEEDESLSNLDVGFKKTKQISVSDVDFTFTSLESQLCVEVKNNSSESLTVWCDVVPLDSKGQPVADSEVAGFGILSGSKTGYCSSCVYMGDVEIATYHIYNIRLSAFDTELYTECVVDKDIKVELTDEGYMAQFIGDKSKVLNGYVTAEIAFVFYDKNRKMVGVRDWDNTIMFESSNYKIEVDYSHVPEDATDVDIVYSGAYYQYKAIDFGVN